MQMIKRNVTCETVRYTSQHSFDNFDKRKKKKNIYQERPINFALCPLNELQIW